MRLTTGVSGDKKAVRYGVLHTMRIKLVLTDFTLQAISVVHACERCGFFSEVLAYHHIETLDHFNTCCCAKSCNDSKRVVKQLATPRESICSGYFGGFQRHNEAAQTHSSIVKSDKGQRLSVRSAEPQIFAASKKYIFFEQWLDVVYVGEVGI